jgi:type VI protein secretion system component VasF
MTLLQLCEPLFQYVCRLNRSARKGGGIYDQQQVRAEVKQILGEMKRKAAGDGRLSIQFDKVELPLIFFADSMIKWSKLPFAEDWQDIAYERNELAGEDRFYELLDETLADRTEAGAERLAVFYTCIGLGFVGSYIGQPVELRKKMLEISSRIRGIVDVSTLERVCPEAYEHLNTSNLIEPPAAKLAGIGIALAGLVVVLFLTNIFLYRDSSKQLTESLQGIVSQSDSLAKDQTAKAESPTGAAPADAAAPK